MQKNVQKQITSEQNENILNLSDMAENEELIKHDIEQPILHGLIHTITFSGFFHSISLNLITTLMSYSHSQYHILLFSLGGIFGLVLSYGLTLNTSKRTIIQLSDFMYLLGILSTFITYSYYYICSFFLGFSMGLCIFALLLDIKEIIPHSSYLAKHMSLYQIYFCIGLMASQLVKLNLQNVYEADQKSTFDVHSFDRGQIAFLLTSMGLIIIRFILLSTKFRMSTPFEIIRFHQSKSKFQTSVHKMYNVENEVHLRENLVHKYKKEYIKSERQNNPRFWKQVLEGFLLCFFQQACGCQIFMNTQELSIEDIKNKVQTPGQTWLVSITGLCSLIAGLQEVKSTLKECIIYPSLRPDIFQGIRAPPRGILLYGPPGNGKTLIAKAVATECKAVFFNLSASSIVSKYMGEGEKLIKALFECAYINQPSIIFIDEIDSILKQRSENEHEASRRIKTEFLIQLDGANTSDQDRITIIAATNCPEQIDSAAFRRFTKRILINVPDIEARIQLIQLNLKGTQHTLNEKQIQELSKQLQGYSCSDIKALVKEACMAPLRKFDQNNLISIQIEQIDKVSLQDMQKAMQTVPPSLQKKELEYFQNLNKKFNQLI
ncbi:hypothetical protein IMG5_013160 [Ichthyophthirius multifiliis]|uniref:AAA+ ATPase domain-containing protein n=1 Tax=Ichthyophthirius multifiliis TaxID=5932 RepID=G0QK53_ICHMU|nr:hypothetical protein IMG5_013160 [Ichthyophthirius multifiliis]EGR34399.1 hypothetical protein IMG5_013160 [Ichthyophthirius multifiliis]|eukprot:XP_004039703.1 hypothetical protein IMG5_013160 [Ichthyophthirius multifiliis]